MRKRGKVPWTGLLLMRCLCRWQSGVPPARIFVGTSLFPGTLRKLRVRGLLQSVVPPARKPRHPMARLSPSSQRATAMRLICLSAYYCRPRPAVPTCCRRYAPHSPRQKPALAFEVDHDVGHRAGQRHATSHNRARGACGAYPDKTNLSRSACRRHATF